MVVRTEKPDLYWLTIADLDHHAQAGKFREYLGIYPRELANSLASREGERLSLSVIHARPD
jgi:hypothetical protein